MRASANAEGRTRARTTERPASGGNALLDGLQQGRRLPGWAAITLRVYSARGK
jgi:hypothetical protein